MGTPLSWWQNHTTASPKVAVLRAGSPAHFDRKPMWASTQRWEEAKGKQTFPENICSLHVTITRGKFTIKVKCANKIQMTHGDHMKFHLLPSGLYFFSAFSYSSPKGTKYFLTQILIEGQTRRDTHTIPKEWGWGTNLQQNILVFL